MRNRPLLLFFFGAFLLASCHALYNETLHHGQDDIVPGHHIIIMKSVSRHHELHGLADKFQQRVHHRISRVMKAFSLKDATDAELIDLRSNPLVDSIHPVRRVRMTSVSKPWSVQNSAPWHLDRIDQKNLPLDSTFKYDYTGPSTTVYIIDTGVRTSHSEFEGRAKDSGFRPSYITNYNPQDCVGHGTHVAGLVAGKTWGVAKKAQIVSLVALGCDGSGTDTDVIAAVDWVTTNKKSPAIISMSLGGGISYSLDSAVRSAANSYNIHVIVAAGNENADACNCSPAREGTVTAVAASTSTDARASYSNWGTCVDIFAPGSSLTSAWYTSDTATATLSGTSMATPVVAGAVAQYLQSNPSITAKSMRSLIKSNAVTNLLTNVNGSPNNLLQLWYSTVDATVATSTPTATPSALPTSTPTSTPTPSPTVAQATLSPTATATPTLTPSPSSSPSPSPSPSIVATGTPTLSQSPTPLISPSATPTATATATPSLTPSSTPTFTPTFTPTSTPSIVVTQSMTPSPTPSIVVTTLSPSHTPTSTPTFTPSPSVVVTQTPSPSPSHTPTSTPSFTPSLVVTQTTTPSPTPSVVVTQTPTLSPTSTPTFTPSPSLTPSIVVTQTMTPSPTPSVVVTQTPTLSPSRTPTPLLSTSTPTPSQPTQTATPLPTSTPTFTPSPSASPTRSPTPSIVATQTATFTPSPTLSPSPSISPTTVVTSSPTSSPTATRTITPSQTQTPLISPTPTPTVSPSPTSGVPTKTSSPTPSGTPSQTPTVSPTRTSSPSPYPSPSLTPLRSPTPSATLTRTPTPSRTPTPTPTPTKTPTNSPTLSLTPSPTSSPSASASPSLSPSSSPSDTPTSTPSATPTVAQVPTPIPTSNPLLPFSVNFPRSEYIFYSNEFVFISPQINLLDGGNSSVAFGFSWNCSGTYQLSINSALIYSGCPPTFTDSLLSSKNLFLAPGSLPGGSATEMHLTVWPLTQPNNTQTASVVILIDTRYPVCKIAGGSHFALGPWSPPFTLDASLSYDPEPQQQTATTTSSSKPTQLSGSGKVSAMTSSPSTSTFSWSCSVITRSSGSEENDDHDPCEMLIGDPAGWSGSKLIADASSFEPGFVFLLTMTYKPDPNNAYRFCETSATLTVVEPISPPMVFVQTPRVTANLHETILLSARAQSLDPQSLTFKWTAVMVYDGAKKVSVPLDLTDSSIVNGRTATSQTLSLRPFGLLPGAVYNFTFEASDSVGTSEAQAVLTINPLPPSFSCYSAPSTGKSLKTLFNFTCTVPGTQLSRQPLTLKFSYVTLLSPISKSAWPSGTFTSFLGDVEKGDWTKNFVLSKNVNLTWSEIEIQSGVKLLPSNGKAIIPTNLPTGIFPNDVTLVVATLQNATSGAQRRFNIRPTVSLPTFSSDSAMADFVFDQARREIESSSPLEALTTCSALLSTASSKSPTDPTAIATIEKSREACLNVAFQANQDLVNGRLETAQDQTAALASVQQIIGSVTSPNALSSTSLQAGVSFLSSVVASDLTSTSANLVLSTISTLYSAASTTSSSGSQLSTNATSSSPSPSSTLLNIRDLANNAAKQILNGVPVDSDPILFAQNGLNVTAQRLSTSSFRPASTPVVIQPTRESTQGLKSRKLMSTSQAKLFNPPGSPFTLDLASVLSQSSSTQNEMISYFPDSFVDVRAMTWSKNPFPSSEIAEFNSATNSAAVGSGAGLVTGPWTAVHSLSLFLENGKEMKVVDSSTPIKIDFVMNSTLPANTEVICAFWNTTQNQWSTSGCNATFWAVNSKLATCQCNHLTDFALFHKHPDPPMAPPMVPTTTPRPSSTPRPNSVPQPPQPPQPSSSPASSLGSSSTSTSTREMDGFLKIMSTQVQGNVNLFMTITIVGLIGLELLIGCCGHFSQKSTWKMRSGQRLAAIEEFHTISLIHRANVEQLRAQQHERMAAFSLVGGDPVIGMIAPIISAPISAPSLIDQDSGVSGPIYVGVPVPPSVPHSAGPLPSAPHFSQIDNINSADLINANAKRISLEMEILSPPYQNGESSSGPGPSGGGSSSDWHGPHETDIGDRQYEIGLDGEITFYDPEPEPFHSDIYDHHLSYAPPNVVINCQLPPRPIARNRSAAPEFVVVASIQPYVMQPRNGGGDSQAAQPAPQMQPLVFNPQLQAVEVQPPGQPYQPMPFAAFGGLEVLPPPPPPPGPQAAQMDMNPYVEAPPAEVYNAPKYEPCFPKFKQFFNPWTALFSQPPKDRHVPYNHAVIRSLLLFSKPLIIFGTFSILSTALISRFGFGWTLIGTCLGCSCAVSLIFGYIANFLFESSYENFCKAYSLLERYALQNPEGPAPILTTSFHRLSALHQRSLRHVHKKQKFAKRVFYWAILLCFGCHGVAIYFCVVLHRGTDQFFMWLIGSGLAIVADALFLVIVPAVMSICKS